MGNLQPDSWWDHAACIGSDPHIFFPRKYESVSTAMKICENCPVKMPCLRYALVRPKIKGVWGGTSERERQRIRRTGLIGD